MDNNPIIKTIEYLHSCLPSNVCLTTHRAQQQHNVTLYNIEEYTMYFVRNELGLEHLVQAYI